MKLGVFKYMHLKIIDNTEPSYIARAERIIELYNEASSCPFDETLNLQRPETTRIIMAEEDSAGVLIDHHPSEDVWRVMFASFDATNRGKGLLNSCLEHAKNKEFDIALVEVNNGDEAAVWRKHGFVEFGSMGMCMTLSNRKLEFINYNAVMA